MHDMQGFVVVAMSSVCVRMCARVCAETGSKTVRHFVLDRNSVIGSPDVIRSRTRTSVVGPIEGPFVDFGAVVAAGC